MLFVPDQDLANSVDELSEREISGLEYLTLGVREGNHLLTGDRTSLRKLANSARLSREAKGTFESAANTVAQFGGLRHKVSVIGYVVKSSAADVPLVNINNQVREISFPVSWFDHSGKIQPSVILGENLSDVFVLKRFAEVAMHLDEWGWIHQSCIEHHGGGDTTAKVFERCIIHKRMTLCVIDSDRAAPAAAIGGTMASILLVEGSLADPVSQVVSTQSRELENLLPNSFFRARYADDLGSKVECLERLTELGEHDVRLHCDIKKGLSLNSIFSFQPESPEAVFWSNKIDAVCDAGGLDTIGLQCLPGNACSAGANSQCTCVIFVSQKRKILEDFLSQTEGRDRFKLSQELDDSVRAEWLRIGKIVASWSCAARPLRV